MIGNVLKPLKDKNSSSSGDDRIILYEEWVNKTWNGLNPYRNSIWTDGDNIYSSNGSNHYILDKSTSTWNTKTWSYSTVNPQLSGSGIWTDGSNMYYSNNYTWRFNKSTNKWDVINDNALIFTGRFVWTDGSNMYYSDSGYWNYAQYILKDISTFTWENKSWNIGTFRGEDIWTVGDDVYLLNGYGYYKLNKSTSSWGEYLYWGSSIYIYKKYIWSDGTNIYHTYDNKTYIFDESSSTWNTKTWDTAATPPGYGDKIWSDGNKVYYSDGDNAQKQFNRYFVFK